MIWRIISTCMLSIFLTPSLQAQSDPVDKNFGGPFAGGQLLFGQGIKVGSSSPGPAWLASADLGFGMKRDTWNRVEFGLELGTGGTTFKDKDNLGIDVDLDLDLVTMIKGAYGYSLGGQAFGFFRVGLGMAQATYDGSLGSTNIDGGSSTGVVSMVAWDAVYMASETVDLVFGASIRFFNFNFNDIPNDAGSFQLNMPAIYGGLRFRI